MAKKVQRIAILLCQLMVRSHALHIASITQLALVPRRTSDRFSAFQEGNNYRDDVRRSKADDSNADKSVESGRRAKVDAAERDLDSGAEQKGI
jgi:hypothetical protein